MKKAILIGGVLIGYGLFKAYGEYKYYEGQSDLCKEALIVLNKMVDKFNIKTNQN